MNQQLVKNHLRALPWSGVLGRYNTKQDTDRPFTVPPGCVKNYALHVHTVRTMSVHRPTRTCNGSNKMYQSTVVLLTATSGNATDDLSEEFPSKSHSTDERVSTFTLQISRMLWDHTASPVSIHGQSFQTRLAVGRQDEAFSITVKTGSDLRIVTVRKSHLSRSFCLGTCIY